MVRLQPAFLYFGTSGIVVLLMELKYTSAYIRVKAIFCSSIRGNKARQTPPTNQPTKQRNSKPLSQQQIRCSMKFPSSYHKLLTSKYIISVYPLQADSLALASLWWSLWCFFYDLEVPQRSSLYLIVALWSLPHKNISSAGAAGPCCDYVWIHSPPVSTQRLFLAVLEAC